MDTANADLAAQKQAARIRARDQRRSLVLGARGAEGTQITRHLADAVATGWILGFSPLPSEPDIAELIERLALEGRLLLPRTEADAMIAAPVDQLASLERSPLGFLQPPLVGERDHVVAVALVPGVAFGRDGSRLGRGKGHYDRFFAANPHILRIGIAFESTVWDTVPHGPLDVPMHKLATTTGLFTTPVLAK